MAKRRSSPFKPQLFSMEDRAVPANLYVDLAFAGKANGATVTFNAGQPNQVSGLTVGTNAFATIEAAITKANSDAAADVITLASDNFNLDAATTGPLLITNPLTLVGSGLGATNLDATSDAKASSGTDGALFAAIGTTFNVRDLSVDGNSDQGIDVASAFRFEGGAVGGVDNVTISNIAFASNISLGYGVVVTGATSDVTVSDSSFINNGRGGVRVDDNARATVQSSVFTGRAGTGDTFINFGVDLSGNSDALITGNTITGFTGTDGVAPPNTITSAAVQVVDSSTATILGNTFDTNATGIIVGLGGTDDSSINAQYNNILNNNAALGAGSGIFVASTATSTAINNNWGSTTGPQAPDNSGGNANSSVTAGVTYKDAGITQPPQGIAQGTLPVAVSTTPTEAKIAASPTATVTGPTPGTSGPITLTVAFSDTVSGFTQGDLVLGGTAGTGTITGFTTSDNKTFTVTVSGYNKRGSISATIAAGAATSVAGIDNLQSNNTIQFQPIFDRGFGVSGDAGITTPVFGVTDAYTTRFGKTAFEATYTGGTRVATADLNGDGTLDYIVASGGGRITEVRTFDGVTGVQTFSVQPFGTSFTRGAYVSAGDLSGDGLAEIVITAERGGGARVRVFSPNASGVFTNTSDFIGIIGGTGVADTNFRGGGRSAVGDINGDGRNDLIFAAGPGGGPRIAIFNGLTLGLNGGPKLTGDFFVFESNLRNGANVAAGDVNGDGKADLLTGAAEGGASRVKVINGAVLASSGGSTVQVLNGIDFFSFGTTSRSGVRVAAEDLDGDGKADLIAAPGAGNGSTVKVYSAANLLANGANPAITQQLSLFGSFNGGLFVG